MKLYLSLLSRCVWMKNSSLFLINRLVGCSVILYMSPVKTTQCKKTGAFQLIRDFKSPPKNIYIRRIDYHEKRDKHIYSIEITITKRNKN